jgi:hypothetical protein
MLLGASLTSVVYADGGNETEPDPIIGGGTNSTIPDGNTTIPDGNTTIPDGNTTEPEVEGAESNNGGPVDPEVLETIREQAQNATQLMSTLFTAEGLSEDIMNRFQHAQQAMQQAENFEENQTRAAVQQYLRSMKHIANAVRKMNKENPELLEQVLGSGNTTATEEFNSTVPENFNETISSTQQELVLRFQERFQEQIMEMYQNVNEMSSYLDPGDYDKAQRALMKAEQKMLRIQEKIDAGVFDEAVDAMENVTDTLDEELGEVGDPGAAQMLRTLYKIEAKIGRMQEKADRKAAMGEDTSDIDAWISQLRGNKYKTKNNYKNRGKGHGKPPKNKPDKNHENNGKGNN